MKTVGIIGGIAPESTIEYYRFILASYRELTGDGSYPPILINSIDLKRMLDLVAAGNLPELIEYLAGNVNKLMQAGADFAVLASNTPHIIFDELRQRCAIPLISIVESTCKAAKEMSLTKLALFGTKFTMQGRFYPDVFSKQGIEIISPQPNEQEYIHAKYMSELINAIFLPETREGLLNIVKEMRTRGYIQGVILGGTELPLILRDTSDVGLPFLDTTKIHVNAIVAEMLS